MRLFKKIIVLIYDGTLDIVGGAERFTINLLKIYESIGLKALLLAFGSNSRILKSNRILVVEIPAMKIMKRSIILPNIQVLRYLLKVVRNADAIHVLYCESPIQLLITLFGKLWGKKVISSPLASLSFLFHHNKLKTLLSIPLMVIKLVITKLSDIVHVASLYDYYYLRPLNRSIVVIPHSFTMASKLIDDLQAKKLRQPVERRLSPHTEGLRLCFLGRFSEDKGSLVALEALRILRSKLGKDAYLIIIGPKTYVLASLINYAKKYGLHALKEILPYIYVTGYIPEEDKYSLLKQCHVGLIPSLSDPVEAFSIALSEFNYLGIPVVASAVGALKFRVKPYAGVLVEPRNPEALARGILRALLLRGSVEKLYDVITLAQEVELWKRALKMLLKY
ncbi:MAG: glycosyltransferase family 4 protein [Desulfurococcales archaeon]|nr:glycosyltransferase family 4 protein [Desulfurococcales archaeon]